MPKKRGTALPAETQQALENLTAQLESIATGGTGYWGDRGKGGLVDTLAAAYRSAVEASRSDEASMVELFRTVTFGQLISERIRQAREDARWTQAELAEAMSAAGASWKRITVAEVEAGTRRVALEELLLLTIIFGLPMVSFLLPSMGDEGTTTDEAAREDFLELPTGSRCYRTLSPDTVRELVLGEGGVEGVGGAEWEAATTTAGGPTLPNDWRAAQEHGEDDWRPARALWAARGEPDHDKGNQ